ncbi:ResB protein required for cytochrome c biosynthesis-like protein [Fictibacillus macauensis ZFHKF-1]|uniref:ResB protein required for cytochrome c biosynthesis-like protein n=1 Tax=Fictibacillus macauensis ZFHKF-1 TaxID=1196324 RepID=I8UIA5_9BACL|nr:cytochrome c biogenesis protein ResB [Fictibacillus macauensis]EIT86548.1 ResB protein required for cytochrome c biosynthesis-like protein [Fictibacillus macauensis ZFHKF-1]
MEKITCECGHVNPFGTEICEACGKPLQNVDSTKLINMRYEGGAVRSQTYKKHSIDKIWNFFSSVKVGIWIIVLILVAAAIGTIFPQQMYIPPTADPSTYYEEEYGTLGKIFYLLGFENLYGSWWFMLLLAALGISLVIVSIDRGFPLYRALKHQRVTRHNSFMNRQRLYIEVTQPLALEQLKTSLKKRRYKVKEENGNWLAEKNRFSRWGPYVNHTGLILFLIGAMLRFFPDMYLDQPLWIKEGETLAIPGTKTEDGQYYLKNNRFIMDTYKENDPKFAEALKKSSADIPSNYQSNVTLYKTKKDFLPGAKPELTKVKDYKLRVNDPLEFDSFSLYQVDFKPSQLDAFSFKLKRKKTDETIGEFTVNLANPKATYHLKKGYDITLKNYYKNVKVENNKELGSKDNNPENPLMLLKIIAPDVPKGERAVLGIQKNFELGQNKYRISLSGVKMKNVSGLTVKKDRTLPIIVIGGLIFMIGVVQGLYWNHRRVWLKKEGDRWLIAAHTNKNWFGMKRELQGISEETGMPVLQDQS